MSTSFDGTSLYLEDKHTLVLRTNGQHDVWCMMSVDDEPTSSVFRFKKYEPQTKSISIAPTTARLHVLIQHGSVITDVSEASECHFKWFTFEFF